jgi:hypothetical protein
MSRRRWASFAVVGVLAIAIPGVVIAAGPAGEHPPGSKFTPYGTAMNSTDPQNAFNDVVSVDTNGGKFGGLERKFGADVRVEQLTNELELKYLLVGRECGGGSPRISLLITPTGNPKDAKEIFGYVGTGAFGGGCPQNQWTYQDLTTGPQWDLSSFGQGFGNTWAQVVSYFDTTYPNHKVLEGFLDDDSSSFAAADAGCAYYDLVSVGAHTYTNHTDAGGAGSNAKNNTCPGG